jgi:hypothetical protein
LRAWAARSCAERAHLAAPSATVFDARAPPLRHRHARCRGSVTPRPRVRGALAAFSPERHFSFCFATESERGRVHAARSFFNLSRGLSYGDLEVNMNSSVVEQSAINERAYLRWQQRGCPDGSPDYDWFEAEQELLREQATLAAASVAVASPAASEAGARQPNPAQKRSRGRRGNIETSAEPAAGTGAPTRRRGPASSTKPAAGSKRRAAS